MKPFDNFEIHGCIEIDDPDGSYTEQCPDADAEFWTLYGHIPGEGVMAIGDFSTREGAEEAFQRITGIPYGSHEEVEARVRVMHAGPRLLEALALMVRWTEKHGLDLADLITGQKAEVPVVATARAAIAEATGRAL